MDMLAKKDLAWFKECLSNTALVAKLKNTKLIISDVDGALTNATVYYTEEKEEGRFFSIQDGYAIKPALNAGLLIALMSGKDNKSTFVRGSKLGIPTDMMIAGMETKIKAVEHVQQLKNVGIEHTLMYGDDFMDADVKINNAVGLFVCPNNAPFYLQGVADVVVPREGGHHAFRLLLDLILYVQGKHFAQSLIDHAIQ